MPNARPRVFLSHASSDKARVLEIRDKLEQAGIECWVDEDEIGVGQSIIEEIQKALDAVDYIVFFISQSSLQSAWVTREVASSLARQISSRRSRILPVKLDDVEPPSLLKDIRWADFSDLAKKSEFDALIRAILPHDPLPLPEVDDDSFFNVAGEIRKLGTQSAHPRFHWFIISGPSSAGKDVLTHVAVERLYAQYNLRKTIKYTTRPRRPSEPDYVKSLSEEEFARQEQSGDIVFPYEKRDFFYGFDAKQMRTAIGNGYPILSVFTHLVRVPSIAAAMNRRGLRTTSIFISVPRDDLARRVLFRNLPPEEVAHRSQSIDTDFQGMATRASFAQEYLFVDNSDTRAFSTATAELTSVLREKLDR